MSLETRRMTRRVGLALVAAAMAVSAQQTGVFGCLASGGKTVKVDGNYAYTRYESTDHGDNARFDARTARWNMQTYPMKQGYPVRVRFGSDVCWSGGMIVGTTDSSARWGTMYSTEAGGGNGTSFFIGAGYNEGPTPTPNFILDGIRIHNSWDGIRIGNNTTPFVIRDVWMTYNRDDAIENDFCNGGLVEDCLFDGVFSFLSSRTSPESSLDGSGNTVTVRNCLIRLQPMPGYGNSNYPVDPSHAMFFKYKSTSPRLVLENNIFFATARHCVPDNTMGVPDGKLVSGKGNVMVWLESSAYPVALPSCITIVKDRSVWDDARTDWINRHPQLARLSTDPVSESPTAARHDRAIAEPLELGRVGSGEVEIYGLHGRRIGTAYDAQSVGVTLPPGVYLVRTDESRVMRTFTGGLR